MAEADLICVYDEKIEDGPEAELEIFDPHAVWKRKVMTDFTARELLVRIYENGKLVYKLPKLNDIRKYCADEISHMWESVLRFENPHNYYVDLSQELWDIKHNMINNFKNSDSKASKKK